MHQFPAIAVCAQQPDRRQGHAVEGVVLAGGVDGHIAEDELITLSKGGVKAVIPDDVPRKAGGAAQADSVRFLPRLTGVQQRRAVGRALHHSDHSKHRWKEVPVHGYEEEHGVRLLPLRGQNGLPGYAVQLQTPPAV